MKTNRYSSFVIIFLSKVPSRPRMARRASFSGAIGATSPLSPPTSGRRGSAPNAERRVPMGRRNSVSGSLSPQLIRSPRDIDTNLPESAEPKPKKKYKAKKRNLDIPRTETRPSSAPQLKYYVNESSGDHDFDSKKNSARKQPTSPIGREKSTPINSKDKSSNGKDKTSSSSKDKKTNSPNSKKPSPCLSHADSRDSLNTPKASSTIDDKLVVTPSSGASTPGNNKNSKKLANNIGFGSGGLNVIVEGESSIGGLKSDKSGSSKNGLVPSSPRKQGIIKTPSGSNLSSSTAGNSSNGTGNKGLSSLQKLAATFKSANNAKDHFLNLKTESMDFDVFRAENEKKEAARPVSARSTHTHTFKFFNLTQNNDFDS